jgi:hypothetical protein
MATAPIGTWWRTSKLTPANEVLRGVTAANTRWVFVGYDSGSPRIYTVQSNDFDNVAPTFTARTPNGSDPLYSVDWIATEDIACAVGDNGRIEISFNKGDSWSSLVLGGGKDMRDVVGLSGSATANMVAVGDGVISARSSGGGWTSRWTGVRFWRSVAYRSGVGWVAVGDGGYATQSPTADVSTFVTPYQAGLQTLYGVGGNASYYIAVGTEGKAYRSATGLSGSWTGFEVENGKTIYAIVPLTSDNNWAAIAVTGESYTSSDNGQTWTKNAYQIADSVYAMDAGPNRAGAVGANGGIYYSAAQTQEDPTAITPPAVEPAFGANSDMDGDAVRRLVGQFRG